MALTETLELQRSAQVFIRRAMRAPLLDASREHDLALRWRDDHDERALHELITA